MMLTHRQRVKYVSVKLLVGLLTMEVILILLGWLTVMEELSTIGFFFTVAVSISVSAIIGMTITQRLKTIHHIQQQSFQEPLVIRLKSVTVDLMLIGFIVSWLGIANLASKTCIYSQQDIFAFFNMSLSKSCYFTGQVVRSFIAGLGLGFLFRIYRWASNIENNHNSQLFLEVNRLRKRTIGDYLVVCFFIYLFALLLYRLFSL